MSLRQDDESTFKKVADEFADGILDASEIASVELIAHERDDVIDRDGPFKGRPDVPTATFQAEVGALVDIQHDDFIAHIGTDRLRRSLQLRPGPEICSAQNAGPSGGHLFGKLVASQKKLGLVDVLAPPGGLADPPRWAKGHRAAAERCEHLSRSSAQLFHVTNRVLLRPKRAVDCAHTSARRTSVQRHDSAPIQPAGIRPRPVALRWRTHRPTTAGTTTATRPHALTMPQPHPTLMEFAVHGSSSTPLDVEAMDSAKDHNVLGIVSAAVRDGRLRSSPSVRQRIAIDHLQGQQHVLRRLDALRKIRNTLGPDIRIGVAKGMAFSLSFYGDAATRTGSDTDLYFERTAEPSLAEIIGMLDPAADVPHLNEMVRSERNFEHSVRLGGAKFDIHHDIMNLIVPTRQHRLLWSQHAEPFLVGDVSDVWTLDREMSTLLAITNAGRDGVAQLRHLLDLKMVLDAQPDWALIDRFAAHEGWQPIVHNTLEIGCNLLGYTNPLPPSRWTKAVFGRAVPARVVLNGRSSLAEMSRRQSAVSALVDRHHLTLVRALSSRVLPPRHVIEARHGASRSTYPLALYRWRREQRRNRRRSTMQRAAFDEFGP